MTWKKELDALEAAKRWDAAVDFLDKTIPLYPNDAELYVRAIYLLLNVLLEEDYSAFGLAHDDIAARLKKYFDISFERFQDNAEYVFFIGYFLSLAEWYFGQTDISLSHRMLKNAAELEPGNMLYEWAYRFVTGDGAGAKSLCNQITRNVALMSWLESKGLPGEYLSAIINSSCQS